MSRGIEEIISDVKSSQISEKQQREKILEIRRSDVLGRIGAAAVANLELGNNENVESLLESRLHEAMSARISHAEAMADLAERGDFSSDLMWWDIKDKEQTIWKGYVVRERIGRLKIHFRNTYLEISTRRAAGGSYVAEVYTSEAITVGLSEETAVAASREACRVHLLGLSLDEAEVDRVFEESMDSLINAEFDK